MKDNDHQKFQVSLKNMSVDNDKYDVDTKVGVNFEL